jgi:hypothetical protein
MTNYDLGISLLGTGGAEAKYQNFIANLFNHLRPPSLFPILHKYV